jgi:hypothetical protein
MATKTIVRYRPPNPIVGARELTPVQMEEVGVFTQQKRLLWTRESGFWLDAERAEISAETLAWLEEQSGEFTVERQEIPEENPTDPPASPQLPEDDSSVVEGERPVGAGTPGGTTTTTTTGRTRA